MWDLSRSEQKRCRPNMCRGSTINVRVVPRVESVDYCASTPHVCKIFLRLVVMRIPLVYAIQFEWFLVQLSAAPVVKNYGCHCPSMMNIITIPYIAMDSTIPTKINTFD